MSSLLASSVLMSERYVGTQGQVHVPSAPSWNPKIGPTPDRLPAICTECRLDHRGEGDALVGGTCTRGRHHPGWEAQREQLAGGVRGGQRGWQGPVGEAVPAHTCDVLALSVQYLKVGQWRSG